MDEARIKNIKVEQQILTVQHIKKLEVEIQNLMKQKAELQDQLDKQIDKQMDKR